MPVKLVSGPIDSGKTARVLELLARTDPGSTGTVVVPDRATAAELRRRFAARLRGGPAALRADSIQDWTSFIRALARPDLPVATRRHSTIIIMGVLERIRLHYFGKTARSHATAEGFARTIIALKENLVRPADLEEIISGLGEARPRERDLIRAYEAYEGEVARLGMLDEADLTLLAIANAADELAGMRLVAFDEFACPTPANLAMLRALGKGLAKAEVVVTCPVAHGDHERPFADWLARARDTWLSACDAEDELDAPKPSEPRVEVVRAASPAQEARHAALMVARSNLAQHDVGVGVGRGASFLEWYLSEAHSMGLLPEHPTLDGAIGSPFAHGLISPDTVERLPARATMAKFVDELLSLADVKSAARSWISGLKKRRGHGRVAARSLTAAAIVEETLRALAAASPMLGATRLTRDQFAQLISHELELRTASATMVESVLPFRRLALGTPLACSAARAIIPRMTEGSFPARAGETLFFGDWKEESISRIFPDAEDRHARDAYAFETMIKKCTGEVTLLMSAVDDAGGQTIPSPFADRFLDGAEPRALRSCVLDRTGCGRKKRDLERLFEVEGARAGGDAAASSPLASYMGVLKSKQARGMVRARFTDGELAPTALERYANCPFAFFAQDVLRVKETPEDTPQIRKLDRGKLVHEILARYYRNSGIATSAAPPRNDKTIEKIVRRIAEEVWEEWSRELGYVSAGLRARETAEAANMALAVVRAEDDEAEHVSSPLSPREFEWEFGRERGGALDIPIKGDAPLLVCGRVDRVDVDSDEGRFLVIDYKSGGADQVVGRIEAGRHLQLPLYIDAVGRSLFPHALPLGGLLIAIKEIEEAASTKKTPGKTKGLVLKEFEGSCYRVGRAKSKVDEERMAELIESARRRAAEFASHIRDGMFAASDEAKCRNCDYGDICRHRGFSAD